MADPDADNEGDDLEDIGKEVANEAAAAEGADDTAAEAAPAEEADGEKAAAEAEADSEAEKTEAEDPVRTKKKDKVEKDKGGSKSIVLLVGVISLVVILSVGIGAGVAGGIALMLMNKSDNKAEVKKDSNEATDDSEEIDDDEAIDDEAEDSDDEETVVDKKSKKKRSGKLYLPPKEASGKAYYYALKPTFLINLAPYVPPPDPEAESGGHGAPPPPADEKLHYLQLSVTLMTRNPKMIEEVAQHQSLIKNDLVVLFSSKSLEDIKTQEGKEEMRIEALQVVRAALNQKVDDKDGVEDIFLQPL